MSPSLYTGICVTNNWKTYLINWAPSLGAKGGAIEGTNLFGLLSLYFIVLLLDQLCDFLALSLSHFICLSVWSLRPFWIVKIGGIFATIYLICEQPNLPPSLRLFWVLQLVPNISLLEIKLNQFRRNNYGNQLIIENMYKWTTKFWWYKLWYLQK